MTRQVVRTTAGKIHRSDDLKAGEKEAAAGILRANPELGNAHAVRCDWCKETRTLFADENDGPFERIEHEHGWRCRPCDTRAASQEIRF
ncbi:MAG TPA: hypothetical protein VF883_12695 [Thermoanaerobaculia bacterium]|jgi:hypothetical protein